MNEISLSYPKKEIVVHCSRIKCKMVTVILEKRVHSFLFCSYECYEKSILEEKN